MMVYVLDIFGVAVFAITGALVARDKQLDLFGGMVLAFVTAVGGGTFRDLVLDIPVFWIADANYVLVTAAAAIFTFFMVRMGRFPRRSLLVADAFGLALFAVLGTRKALGAEVAPTIAVVMGIMTGVGGGMIRDVLAGQVPLVLRSELYATIAAVGAIGYILLSLTPLPYPLPTVISVTLALLIRLGAIKWKWKLPVYPTH